MNTDQVYDVQSHMTFAGFAEWLYRQDRKSIVGYAFDVVACPIAQAIASLVGDEVTVLVYPDGPDLCFDLVEGKISSGPRLTGVLDARLRPVLDTFDRLDGAIACKQALRIIQTIYRAA